MPYSDKIDPEVITELYCGRHPSRLSIIASGGGVPDCLWSLLLDCWSPTPGNRPSASVVRDRVSSPAFVDEFSPWFESMIRSRFLNATSKPEHSGRTTTGKSSRMSHKCGPFYLRSVASRTCYKDSPALIQDRSSPQHTTVPAEGSRSFPSSPVCKMC